MRISMPKQKKMWINVGMNCQQNWKISIKALGNQRTSDYVKDGVGEAV